MSDPTDIRDIRLPQPQPWRDFLLAYWPWLALAVLVLFGLLLAWRWWRRRAARRPALPLLQDTLARLEQARPLLQAGDVEGFSVRVSEIIRRYVEQRFQMQTRQRTTLEFLHACVADTASPLAEYRTELGQFLQFCDLAKFARWSPSGPEMESMLTSARAFVQRTAGGAAASVPQGATKGAA